MKNVFSILRLRFEFLSEVFIVYIKLLDVKNENLG